MKAHFGRTDHRGYITFINDGYMYKGLEDEEFRFVRYPEPRPATRDIKRMFGFSIFNTFFGIMICGKVKK
jgi:hypothetical protein